MPNPLPPETTPEWTAKLLPCPFCGNASVTARECSDDDDRWAVACDSKASECPMEITVYDCYDRESAIAAWNRRASVPNTGTALSEEDARKMVNRLISAYDGVRSIGELDVAARARRSAELVAASDAIVAALRSAPSRGSDSDVDPEQAACARCGLPKREHRMGYAAHRCAFYALTVAPLVTESAGGTNG